MISLTKDSPYHGINPHCSNPYMRMSICSSCFSSNIYIYVYMSELKHLDILKWKDCGYEEIDRDSEYICDGSGGKDPISREVQLIHKF